MKIVIFAKGHLVGLAAGGGENKKIRILMTEMRAIDDPLPIRRPVRTRPEERLFLMNHLRLPRVHDIRLDRSAPESAGTQRYPTIGDEDQLLAVRRPGWGNVHIELSE